MKKGSRYSFVFSGEGEQTRYLLLIFILALALRLVASLRTPVIAQDSAVYLESAGYVMKGDFKAWLTGWEPLYPLLTAALGKLLGSLEWGGRGVSILLGAASIFPLSFLTRRIFGWPVSLLTGLVFALHPFLLAISAEALTDAAYIFFLLCALWQGWEGISRGRFLSLFLAGLSGGAAYLVRPEGAALLILLGLWAIAFILWWPAKARGSLIPAFLLLLMGFLVMALPYILYLKSSTGYWVLTRRYAISALVGMEEAHPITAATGVIKEVSLGRLVPAAGFVVKNLVEKYHPFLVLLVGLALWRVRLGRYDIRGQAFLLSIVIFYVGLIFFIFLVEGRSFVQGRYLLHQIPILLPWGAVGFLEGWHKCKQWGKAGSRFLRWLGVLVLVAGLAAMALQGLRGRRQDKVYLVEVGRWIAAHTPRPAVISSDPRISFYAGSRNYFLKAMPVERLMRTLAQGRVNYLVVNQADREMLGYDLLPLLEPTRFQAVYQSQDQKGRGIYVFAVRYAALAAWLASRSVVIPKVISYDPWLAEYLGAAWLPWPEALSYSGGLAAYARQKGADYLIIDAASPSPWGRQLVANMDKASFQLMAALGHPGQELWLYRLKGT